MKNLSRNEMKKVIGGKTAGTCQALTPNGVLFVDQTSAQAQQEVSGGGKWCCDSCCSSTWASKATCA